jgi:hypothetical protein
MASRLALALLVAVAAFAAATTDASACSCALGDPRKMLADSDAAFVGRLVAQPSGPVSSSAQQVPYVFEVDREVKGRLPERIEVYAAASGASCGIETPVGEPVGLFLRREGGRWVSGLCLQVAPAELLAAARPLPAPNGQGPLALLAGGSFGGVRTIALDRRGRTLGYGRGRGETVMMDVCPGGTRAVEIARDWPTLLLAVRDLRTLRLLRQQPLRLREELLPSRVDCRTANGDTILLFAYREAGPLGVITELRDGRPRELHRGQSVAAVFGRRHAYVVTGQRADRLAAVDLERGSVRRLGSVPAGTGALALSPDGAHLAAVAYSAPVRDAPPSSVVVLDLRQRTPSVRSVRLSRSKVSGTIGWLDNGSFAFLPGGGDADALRIYDTRLRLRARRPWSAQHGVVRNGIAYGITWGLPARVVQASLPGGPTRTTAGLPGRTVYALTAAP